MNPSWIHHKNITINLSLIGLRRGAHCLIPKRLGFRVKGCWVQIFSQTLFVMNPSWIHHKNIIINLSSIGLRRGADCLIPKRLGFRVWGLGLLCSNFFPKHFL